MWKLIFASCRAKEWKDILLANFQHSSGTGFSLLKRVKTDGRASLGDTRLNSLLRICMEGPECADLDAIKALNVLASSVLRPPNQRARETYKPRHVKDDDSEDEI